MTAGLGFGRFGAANLGKLGNPIDHADHLFGHFSQDVVRCSAVAGTLEILKCSFGVVRKGDTPAGENGNPSGVWHLFEQQNFRARVMSCNRRNSARGSIADDDDIDFFIPMILSITSPSKTLAQL